jgi:hypothetical protein
VSAEKFAYWLQGFYELTGGAMPTPEQWKSIGEHLAKVFEKQTPPVGQSGLEATKSILDAARLGWPSTTMVC